MTARVNDRGLHRPRVRLCTQPGRAGIRSDAGANSIGPVRAPAVCGGAEGPEAAFVEDLNASVRPYRASLSTFSGTRFVVECFAGHAAFIDSDDDFHAGSCDALPILSWIRIGVCDVIRSPQSSSWGMRYRSSEFGKISEFLIKAICYPNGDCITSDEAGARAVEVLREARRRGDQ